MLKWIVGGKVDHPLADMKQARELVAELPPHDYNKALEEITRWLNSLNEVEGFKLDRLVEVAELLDITAKNHQRRLIHDYLGTSRQQKFQENKLWTCGFNYSKALGETYLRCVRQFQKNASGSSAVRKQIPVLVARALRAMATQVKWIMLRYGPFDPRLWRSIGELHRYGEAGGFADTVLTIYPGAHGSGTVKQESLKIMMLWASSADGLPPLKQEIAERTVAQFASVFTIGKAPYAGAMYWFDQAGEKPPGRLIGNTPTGTDIRYFGPGNTQAKLAEIVPVLEKTGAVPSSLTLGANYAPEVVLAVLKHLSLYWSETPPARASERRAATERITVVPGYSGLLDELERDESDALNFSETNAESWVVENMSDNGYGAFVPATTSDWIRVGELIGFQVEGSTEWGIGLVRRVVRDEQRQYHVGIEVVSRAVVVVRISHGEATDAESALLLSAQPDSNAEIGVVMRAGRYDAKNPVEVAGRNNSYLFSPSRMVDAGDDFDWAVYKVSRQAS